MANWYVWNAAAGGGTGADWANAYVNLSSISAKAAGDVFYVAHDHVQTQASALTITSPGTEALPCRIYCVNRAGTVPPVSADLRTTAQVSTTAVNNITLSGTVSECYGIIFSAGNGASTGTINVGGTASRTWRLVSCALNLGNTSATSRIALGTGAAANLVVLENCTMQFGAVGQTVSTSGRSIWRGGSITGSFIPTIFFTWNGGSTWFVEGVDLGAMTSGKTLFTLNNNSPGCSGIIKDCKLGSGVIVGTTPPTAWGQPEIMLIRCDGGDTNYRTEKWNFAGTQTTETTIVRTGGATDGTTPISWKIVTSANSRWELPFESLPISVWNEGVGSAKTVTVQGIWGTGTVPKNDDIWIEVEYLGTSGFPLGARAKSTKVNGLIGNADIPAGSGTWGGSTTKFAMAVTFTPQEKGPFTIYVCAAKASSTFYIDPNPVVT